MSRPTNCVNCGAVLKSWKCEYCGTEYRELEVIHTNAQDSKEPIETTSLIDGVVLRMNDEEYKRELIDITTHGDIYPVYMDIKTGERFYEEDGVFYRCLENE